MENILDSLLFLMGIWAESVNKLILVPIRMVKEFFALAMEKINIIDCFSLLEGFIDDSNDDKMILKLKSEFEDDGHDKYSSSIPGFYSEYLLRKSVMDMEMRIKKHSTHPMTSLLEFLSTTCQMMVLVELLKQISSSSDELVLLVCLVRMADSLASSLRIVPLASALDQAFEIIVFIHAKTITKSGSNTMKINVAKDIWMNKSNKNHWFQTDIIDPLKEVAPTIYVIVLGLFDNYLPNFVICELYDIINIIGEPRVEAIRSTNGSVEELYDRIE
ncbi:hypothetical protein Syun_030609 [Stephania yunnanensis]|uniref:Uncharacterized protein n=1 Tax=Stephania yunnanensis TaxID=152371 RepID=A0AAP0DUF6_9MAGN